LGVNATSIELLVQKLHRSFARGLDFWQQLLFIIFETSSRKTTDAE